jgi:hypothetical protein
MGLGQKCPKVIHIIKPAKSSLAKSGVGISTTFERYSMVGLPEVFRNFMKKS